MTHYRLEAFFWNIKFQSSLLRCSHCDSDENEDLDADDKFQSSLLRCFHCDSTKKRHIDEVIVVSILSTEVF